MLFIFKQIYPTVVFALISMVLNICLVVLA